MAKVDLEFAIKCLENADASPLAAGTTLEFPTEEQERALKHALDQWENYWEATYELFHAFRYPTKEDK